MQVSDWIRARGGIAHRRDLRAAGWGKDRLGGLMRVGRNWVTSGTPDPALVAAARARARLACLSAAKHRGLPLLHEPDRLHLWVGPSGEHSPGPGVRLHRSKPFVPVGPTSLVEPVEHMLAHVAKCLPEAEALVVWDGAVRLGLVSTAELRRIAWPGPAPRRLARFATAQSDSLLETLLAHQLRAAGIEFRQQVRLLERPVDFLIGSKLVVQADGFGVHQAAQRRSDIAFDAELMVRGVHVLRFDFVQVVEHRVVAVVLRAMAQGLHR